MSALRTYCVQEADAPTLQLAQRTAIEGLVNLGRRRLESVFGLVSGMAEFAAIAEASRAETAYTQMVQDLAAKYGLKDSDSVQWKFDFEKMQFIRHDLT